MSGETSKTYNHIRIVLDFTVRPATGPNPQNNQLEVVDDDGLRLGYFDSTDDVKDYLIQTFGGRVSCE